MPIYIHLANLIVPKPVIEKKYAGGADQFRTDYSIDGDNHHQEDDLLFSIYRMNCDDYDLNKLVEKGLDYDFKEGRSILYSAIREYLACLKIRDEYQSTLEQDQKADLKSRIHEANTKIQKELVTAYNHVHKYSASSGISTVELKQLAESLDRQISNNLYDRLKEEEWLLEMVGHNTLKKNNLLPEDGKPIQSNTVLEAFLRYDDKPMINDKSAIQNSLTKYCYNKQFAIAAKSSDGWANMYLGESVPMFDVEDETFWLVSRSDYSEWLAAQENQSHPSVVDGVNIDEETVKPTEYVNDVPGGVGEVQEFKKLVISGKANAVGFNQLFSSFIMPLKENDVEIEFRITAKSKSNYPITENSQQYKIVKESARQLGFQLDEE